MKFTQSVTTYFSVNSVLSDFKALTKVRLAVVVVISSIAGYFLGADTVQIDNLLLLGLGGYCMVGASNIYNQIIERDLDAVMKRTQNRPIPDGRVSPPSAFFLAAVLTILGVIFLYALNPRTAFFGSVSIFLYACVYTPLKTITPLSVFVGAIPGAIPFMLGWVAATNDFGIEPGTLFMIQFFWQFPHFWALGWMLDEDYKKGGFKMLPTGKKDSGTALQIILYIIWMILISIMPVFGYTGELKLSIPAAVLVFCMGMVMLVFAFKLYEKRTNQAARKLMLASVLYITLMQAVYVFDKFL